MASHIKRIEPILTPSEKVISYREAIDRIKTERDKGKKTVLVRGIFDIVHIGHINFLRASKSLGDVLIVGLDNDEAVGFNKGTSRPFNSLANRLNLLAEISSVDFVFSFDEILKYVGDPRYTEQYKELNPDIVALNEFEENLELRLEEIRNANVRATVFSFQKENSTSRLLKLIGYE